jgi:hypothetical protein
MSLVRCRKLVISFRVGPNCFFTVPICRYFWLRWTEGRVQVGEGSTVGSNLVMEHAKSDHPELIASIGISTGWLEVGRWEITNIEGWLSYGYLFYLI